MKKYTSHTKPQLLDLIECLENNLEATRFHSRITNQMCNKLQETEPELFNELFQEVLKQDEKFRQYTPSKGNN